MAMAIAPASKQWTRVRTLGRGASGAEVFLASDDVSGELFAVKSACASGAAALRREQAIMISLRSPRVVSCIGGRAARDGSYQLFLEFAPGGSLADEVAKAGRLEECAVRAYAADVSEGLAYLHGESMVHGDIKARNIVLGADGRAQLADFGCARKAGEPIIGGTPAFMAPEVARGEEQGAAADVWALGCTVVEMATGRAPWSGMDGDALSALDRIGYTNAAPEVPEWLSTEAKDFLVGCFTRRPSDRWTAAQLLEHPFLASAVEDAKLESVEGKWVSPKSTLDAAFWESESDSEVTYDDELSRSSRVERIMSLACTASAFPDWDSDEGWIDVLSSSAETSDAVAVPAKEETADLDDAITREEQIAEPGVLEITVDSSVLNVVNAREADGDYSVRLSRHQLVCQELPSCKLLLVQRVRVVIKQQREVGCAPAHSTREYYASFSPVANVAWPATPPARRGARAQVDGHRERRPAGRRDHARTAARQMSASSCSAGSQVKPMPSEAPCVDSLHSSAAVRRVAALQPTFVLLSPSDAGLGLIDADLHDERHVLGRAQISMMNSVASSHQGYRVVPNHETGSRRLGPHHVYEQTEYRTMSSQSKQPTHCRHRFPIQADIAFLMTAKKYACTCP
uniref:Uncharacterized protein n=1 Tax=Avena sativa TaxID=4498 RepID=A0ACD5T7U2_AVESA